MLTIVPERDIGGDRDYDDPVLSRPIIAGEKQEACWTLLKSDMIIGEKAPNPNDAVLLPPGI